MCLNTKSIDFLIPSLEDLVVMKLYSYRGQDPRDLNSPKVVQSLDWELLEHLIYSPGEAYSSLATDIENSYRVLLQNFEEYKERHHESYSQGLSKELPSGVDGSEEPENDDPDDHDL